MVFSPSELRLPLRCACCQRRAFLMLCLPGWLVGSVYSGGDGGSVADALLSAPACVTDDGSMDRFVSMYMQGAAYHALVAGHARCGLRHCSAYDRLCVCGRMGYYRVLRIVLMYLLICLETLLASYMAAYWLRLVPWTHILLLYCTCRPTTSIILHVATHVASNAHVPDGHPPLAYLGKRPKSILASSRHWASFAAVHQAQQGRPPSPTHGWS